ncbi:hypothetical protein [Azospirillum sp. ST 5-10]|uniref:hypothetical protein n=1 Tax=unclassified Azospirillum TaxID=2630922 RepID=UPI003F49EA74
MSDPAKRFAPPPPHWPGRPPAGAAQAKPGPGAPPAHAPAARPVAQPQATFGALRSGRPERARAGDELVRIQGDDFLLKTADRGLRVKPNGTYNFVRVQGTTRNDAHTYVSARSGHAGLAGGKPVLYAGTARFDSGRLEWWSNYSGTYQPVAALNRQAQLPGELFVPWQKLQMGGIGMQRGMLTDQRAAGAPARPAARAQAAAEAPAKKEEPGRPAATHPPAARPPAPEAAKRPGPEGKDR